MTDEEVTKMEDMIEMTKQLVSEDLLFPAIQQDGSVLWVASFAGGEEHVGNKEDNPAFTWDDLLEMYKKERK